jgi:magnesium transporter
MSTTVVRWLDQNGTPQQGDIEALGATLGQPSWTWVDVVAPTSDDLSALETRFDLHPLALEDTAHARRRAKVDTYPSGLFLVWVTPHRPRGNSVSSHELDVFIGKDYLVTLHAEANKTVDNVAADTLRTLKGGPDWTLHAIIDQLVDSTMPLVDSLGEQLEAVEERMLEAPRQEDLLSLHKIRRQLLRLHRIVAPERDVIRGVGRERDVVSEDAYRYFQDVGDHLSRVQDSIETYQDVASSVMDVYLSAQNNRMNEIMKQLTVVATIFMPLTLLSGIYGMNVIGRASGPGGMWPPVEAAWSFWVVVVSMVVIAGAMAAYFRRKNWW